MARPLRDQSFLILVSLASEPRHGYGVIKDVVELSDGALRLRTGTLYGALDRLTADGLVEADREETEHRRRAAAAAKRRLARRGRVRWCS